MRRLPLPAVLALGALAGSVAIVAAWAVDARAQDDEVLPNVHLAGHSVRGLPEPALQELVREVAETFGRSVVEVNTRAGRFEATTPELGAEVDVAGTVAAAMQVGREGSAPRRLWAWARSFIVPIDLPVAVVVDRKALDTVVAERDPSRVPAEEPFFVLEGGRLEGRAGRAGEGTDPAVLARALGQAEPEDGRIVLQGRPAPIPPRFGEADIVALAAAAERLADGRLTIGAGEATATVPAPTFRLWVHAVPTATRMRLGIKPSADVVGDAAELLPHAGTPPVDAGFTVRAGAVQIVEGRPGTRCCGEDTPAVIDEALANGDLSQPVGPVMLPLRPVEPRRTVEEARALGVTEVVGSFTTSHAPGEPRVRNIHRMADLLRGAVIEPGQTFSINQTVGPRTVEKGFVSAPIIGANNVLEEDVGGGVSQIATTAFNAAFFAGLDILEYGMHGLYISRYPFGREATLSYPVLDLRLRNNTPHGVLVWTSYTETSITIALYSTRYVVGTQTGQTVEEREPTLVPEELRERHEREPFRCQSVTTERTRRFVDTGRTVVDRFYALYSPAQGVRCH